MLTFKKLLAGALLAGLAIPGAAQVPAPPTTPPTLTLAAGRPVAQVPAGQFVRQHGRLQVVGTHLVDQYGEQLVLRGVSLGWHSLWPRFYNEAAVQWLRQDFHCNVVRAAMGIEVGERNYQQDPTFSKAKIDSVVQGAIKADMYVIIDWHSHNINLREAKEFFAEASKKYAKYPNVLYEVFNEPDKESWPAVKAYAEEIIKVIRANDPTNIILVGCPQWDQAIDLPAANPIAGYQNLMYTMHFYAATHGKWLRDRTDAALQRGLPVFVSESAGMEASGDGPLNPVAWQQYLDWLEARGLSWVVWSVSDKDETCSMLQKSASSTGPWQDADLKESGLKTRAYLRRYNTAK